MKKNRVDTVDDHDVIVRIVTITNDHDQRKKKREITILAIYDDNYCHPAVYELQVILYNIFVRHVIVVC